MNTDDKITLALPSKGAIADPTLSFLAASGLSVNKPNPRQYTGTIPTLPAVNVLFQRVRDVLYKVADGTAQLGITGLDVVMENPHKEIVIIHDGLNYGHCQLIVAVPEAWVDVSTVDDLIDIAIDFRENKRRNLRVATTFPHLTRQFFHANGIHHFTLVKAEGAIEAAPTIGYADIIVDLTQTGTTLRENHLKPLTGGTIIDSQACLIGNRQALHNLPLLLDTLRPMLEYIDGSLTGKRYSQLTVNIRGESAEEIGDKVTQNPITSGLLGPTIAPIYSANTPHAYASSIYDARQWYTVTVTLRTKDVLSAVEYFRSIGGSQIVSQPVQYIFLETSPTFTELMRRLEAERLG